MVQSFSHSFLSVATPVLIMLKSSVLRGSIVQLCAGDALVEGTVDTKWVLADSHSLSLGHSLSAN